MIFKNRISKPLVLLLMGLSGAVILSACTGPTETVEVEPSEAPATSEVPATEDPTAQNPVAGEGETATGGDTVVDLAASNESFSTLATAIEVDQVILPPGVEL